MFLLRTVAVNAWYRDSCIPSTITKSVVHVNGELMIAVSIACSSFFVFLVRKISRVAAIAANKVPPPHKMKAPRTWSKEKLSGLWVS